jgi:hypothetical protein
MSESASAQPADVAVRKPESKSFPLSIDYSKSLAESVTAGHYDFANLNITEENFPTTMGDPEIVDNPTGLHVVEADLVHLDCFVGSYGVLREMECLGLRPGTMRELTAFGEHSDIQRQYLIVALGSVWTNPIGDRVVGCLWEDAVSRGLRLSKFDDGWRAGARFLAFRK